MEYKDLEQLQTEINKTVADINLDEKRSLLGELETKTIQPDFWENKEEAEDTLKEISIVKKEIAIAEKLQSDIQDIISMWNSSSESDREELEPYYQEIKKQFDEFQVFQYLSEKYDKSDCILTIHAGQGGTDANDWAEMLLRMYKMYCDKKGFKYEILHITKGTEAGISSVTLSIKGPFAYGLLKKETGTHRLVRLSPFNAKNLRQTSFAGVEVIPQIKDDDEIKINEKDIEFKAVRASGPGGQFVNKTSSAVQIKHIPTGITVHCSERRDQLQNRKEAIKILKARLWKLKQEKKEKELKELKGEHKTASWGNQIRNYVLHPYKLVKDLRTGVESSNPTDVLNGNLEEFINEEIKLKD